jgi:hypothetical protein
MEQAWQQIEGQAREMLKRTVEGLLVAERDRRVSEAKQRGEKLYRWGYTVRKCWTTLWGSLQQVRVPRLRGWQEVGLNPIEAVEMMYSPCRSGVAGENRTVVSSNGLSVTSVRRSLPSPALNVTIFPPEVTWSSSSSMNAGQAGFSGGPLIGSPGAQLYLSPLPLRPFATACLTGRPHHRTRVA